MESATTTRRLGPDSGRAGAAHVRGPGILLGIGLGGFVDGIVLHQILQWHHMLTSHGDYPATTVAGLEANTLADGLFHAFAWVAVAAGVFLLWRRGAMRRAQGGRELAGWALVGWGIFNLVEGIVDHHLLTIHHVRDDVSDPLPWDLGFLALGAVLVAVGFALHRLPQDGEERGGAVRPPGKGCAAPVGARGERGS
jgi:uncharacterized membrane protein